MTLVLSFSFVGRSLSLVGQRWYNLHETGNDDDSERVMGYIIDNNNLVAGTH